MQTDTINQVTIPKELCEMIEAIEGFKEMNPKTAREILLANPIPLGLLQEFIDYDHPVEDCYGRQIIYKGENFEIMLMSWNPGDFSAIHDHGHTQWGAVYLYGNAQHILYSVKQDQITVEKKEILKAGSAVAVNNALIHQMGNPTSERFASLHLYGCENRMDEITGDARIYEVENKVIKHTAGGVFFNLPDTEVYDFESCPEPDSETLIYNCGLLLAYYSRQNFPSTKSKVDHVLNLLREMDW